MTGLIDPVDEIPTGVCRKWCTNDEMDHSRRQGTEISEKGDLFVRRASQIKIRNTLIVNMLEANRAIALFSENVPCSVPRFYLNRFDRDLFTYFFSAF